MSFGGSSMYLTLYVAVKTDCHILEDTYTESSSSKSSSSSAAASNGSKFLEKPRRFVDRHFGNSSKNKCSLR
ncbi:hypothetical protein TYRP_018088 [Tyrophagus putrescentiae]|nr:hypothetical protein TYRP_018088 [Tyrophagus putrescentiae]